MSILCIFWTTSVSFGTADIFLSKMIFSNRSGMKLFMSSVSLCLHHQSVPSTKDDPCSSPSIRLILLLSKLIGAQHSSVFLSFWLLTRSGSFHWDYSQWKSSPANWKLLQFMLCLVIETEECFNCQDTKRGNVKLNTSAHSRIDATSNTSKLAGVYVTLCFCWNYFLTPQKIFPCSHPSPAQTLCWDELFDLVRQFREIFLKNYEKSSQIWKKWIITNNKVNRY